MSAQLEGSLSSKEDISKELVIDSSLPLEGRKLLPVNTE